MKAKTTVRPGKPAPKHQRLKIALIPVLLLILAYVMFTPTDETNSDNLAADNIPARSPAAGIAGASRPAAGADSRLDRSAKTQAWPEADLQFLAISSPFKSLTPEPTAVPDQRLVGTRVQAPVEEVDHLADVASELERRPVNFVFRSSKQNVIMLGDEVLEKGARISPAVQLHDIDDHALLLKRQP